VTLRDLEQARRARAPGVVPLECPGRLGQHHDGLVVTTEPVVGVAEEVEEIGLAKHLRGRADVIVDTHATPLATTSVSPPERDPKP
jgi:hypothetical protein